MNATPIPTVATIVDRFVRVRGTVQGVGFRPFVQKLATKLGVRGWVRNDARGVLIRVRAEGDLMAKFVSALRDEAPRSARVADVVLFENEAENGPPIGDSFVISPSENTAAVATAIPADLALCADCRQEMLDFRDRRFGYAFVNCTQCGPRYSLIESLPYDRESTTMRVFEMCATCEREYRNPANRRFHAEPIACPECGPQLYFADVAGKRYVLREGALTRAAEALRAGKIVAVKRIGGFHLMCDATNETAVANLRRRKHREEKPFAVMFPSLAALMQMAEVSDEAVRLLESPAAPIVLVPRRPGTRLAESVAPGNPWIGALLPYSPVHVLLLSACARPLVATSANLSEEPLCIDDAEARERLEGIADFFLGHDRAISRPVDDSVVKLSARAAPILLRRARGYAPAPIQLPQELPSPILCVGGQMKNTVAVAADDRVVVSPHIGDLANAATQQAFTRTIKTLTQLHGSRFTAVVHDKHPDYTSTRYAQASGLPTIGVQHHLAHVLACLLENRQPADGVLGVAWDGTGYGEDGTMWGGEFILLERGTAKRFARLRPFRLLGGEAAVRDPRRVALALAFEIGDGALVGELVQRFRFSVSDADNFATMIASGLNSPQCSSVGRLFDAVGALLGLGVRNTFEGQLPMAVEAAAWRERSETHELPFAVNPVLKGGAMWEVEWAPMMRALLHAPADAARQAAAFHRGLARTIVEVARHAGVGTVALSGGSFQNALLHDLAGEWLRDAGFRVLVHRELSPNDGSLAAGQALGALWNLTDVALP